MEVSPDYKLTKVGAMPEDWELISIGKAGNVLGGRQRCPQNVGELCKYLRVANVFDGYLETEDVLKMPFTTAEKERFLLKSGDILLNEGQSIDLVGRSAIYRGIPNECCFQNTLIRFRANRNTCVEFAQVVFQQYLRIGVFAAIASQTTSIAHLGAARFAALKMALPPLPEQEAIARALGDADALIESLEQLVAKKRRLKQAAMQDLLRPKDGWRTSKLGCLGAFVKGTGVRKDESASGDLPCVRYGEIYTRHNDRIKRYHSWISKEVAAKAKRLKLGDVLFAGSGETKEEIGKCVAFVDAFEAYAGGDIVILRPENVSSVFLGYYLNTTPISRQKASKGQGDAVVHVSASALADIDIRLPRIEEQTAIAGTLSDMDADIDALEVKLAKYRHIKQGMMHKLLTGQIRFVSQRLKIVHCEPMPKPSPRNSEPHNWQINEAVVISVLAKNFGSRQFPLGRKRYTKLSYLLHRHVEGAPEGYLKKSAGPYNPATKYKGPESIAQRNRYVRRHQRGQMSGFIEAEAIVKAEEYFYKWYGIEALAWLEQFRYRKNDDLERLATVDMAMQDLVKQGKDPDRESVRSLIASEREWVPKLDRSVFSDDGIDAAIAECKTLFPTLEPNGL